MAVRFCGRVYQNEGAEMNGIPVLTVEGDCIARAWENSLIALYEQGCDIST
jgi:hypothetical protein